MVDYDWKGESLRLFLQKKKIPVTEAAKMLNVSRQTIYQYFNSKTLTREVVESIKHTFKVNEGDLFEAKFIDVVNDDPASYGGYQNTFIELKSGKLLMFSPLVEEYAQAGFLSGFMDKNFIEELPQHSIIVDKYHKGKYFSFRVIGDSMDNGTSDSILDGSIVTAREIKKDLWRSKFHINKFKDYVIVHNEGILVKRIIKHDVDSGTITCHSLNEDKTNYADFDINLDDCKMILNIVNVSVSR